MVRVTMHIVPPVVQQDVPSPDQPSETDDIFLETYHLQHFTTNVIFKLALCHIWSCMIVRLPNQHKNLPMVLE